MYGMVNQAVRDLVIRVAGEAKWLEIRQAAGVTTEDFVAMDDYPDAMTYQLVGAASKSLGLSAEAVLREFGKHWIKYTASEGYGPLMDMFGHDYFEAIQNINHLHARIGLSMPQLSAPKFRIERRSEDVCLVEYISKREGLGPMMLGLLEGLAEKHGASVSIERFPAGTEATHESFLVTRIK